MTAPSLTKVWDPNILNLAIAADGTQAFGTTDATNDRKTLYLALVGGWLAATGSGITVTRSCDASTAADSNLLTDITKLRWNTGHTATHSWQAFQMTNLSSSGNVWMLISHINPSGRDGSLLDVWISVDSAFTGGSPTSRPTATNEVQIKDGLTTVLTNFAGFWGVGTSTNAARAFVLQQQSTSDGQCNRTQVWLGAICIGYISLERMANPQGQTYDFFIKWIGTGSDSTPMPTDNNVYSTDNYVVGLTNAKARVKYRLTIPNQSDSPVNTEWAGRRPDLSVPVIPVGIFSDGAGWLGQWGELFDWRWGLSDGINAKHLPNDAVPDWVQIYDFLIPWQTSTLMQIN